MGVASAEVAPLNPRQTGCARKRCAPQRRLNQSLPLRCEKAATARLLEKKESLTLPRKCAPRSEGVWGCRQSRIDHGAPSVCPLCLLDELVRLVWSNSHRSEQFYTDAGDRSAQAYQISGASGPPTAGARGRRPECFVFSREYTHAYHKSFVFPVSHSCVCVRGPIFNTRNVMNLPDTLSLSVNPFRERKTSTKLR